MPRALPVPQRRLIVERIGHGEPIAAVAEDLGLSYWTVRTLWRRYRDRGREALTPDYDRCGHPGVRGSRLIYRAAIWLRRRHPGWGAELIRTILGERYPDEPLPAARTLRRWFAAQGLSRPPRPPRQPPPPRATVPHATWQMDAKEQISLADGTRVSWLAITDEASGAILEAAVFPPGDVESGRSAGGAGDAGAILRPLGATRSLAGRQRAALGRGE